MDKIWTSAKVKIRNRLDFIHYGQRIGYINIVAIVIDLAILLYSAIDYQTLMQPVPFPVPGLYDPYLADDLFRKGFLRLHA